MFIQGFFFQNVNTPTVHPGFFDFPLVLLPKQRPGLLTSLSRESSRRGFPTRGNGIGRKMLTKSGDRDYIGAFLIVNVFVTLILMHASLCRSKRRISNGRLFGSPLSTTVSASLGLKDFFLTVIKAVEVPMSKKDPARKKTRNVGYFETVVK